MRKMSDIKAKVADMHDEGDASAEDSAGEMTWPRPEFTSQNLDLKSGNDCLLKKKRTHYNSFSHAPTTTTRPDSVITGALQRLPSNNRVPYGKNSRKSRNGFKGIVKKSSSKDVWIRVSDELDELELDHEDPDYDSDEHAPVVIEPAKAALSDDDFEQIFSSLVNEFYDHCQVQEVIDGLKEITITPLQRRRIPFLAVTKALQHKMSNCELTSELLSEMCGKIISMSGMQQGFQLILDDMPDIVLDVPKAPEYVGRFIARAIADDILPPKFVQQYKESYATLPPYGTPPVTGTAPPVRIACRSNSGGSAECSVSIKDSSGVSSMSDVKTAAGVNLLPSPSGDAPVNYALQAINKAEMLLTLSHAYSRLDIVWGIPPSERVTTLLMKQITAILEEYLRSDNLDGAVLALNELDSPHFHHELVYQAILLVLERDAEQVANRILHLLDSLCRSVVISLDQLVTGVKRIYVELPEIQRELPVAHVLLERFLRSAVKLGFLPQKVANEMPSMPRKRFVSEGDCMRKT